MESLDEAGVHGVGPSEVRLPIDSTDKSIKIRIVTGVDLGVRVGPHGPFTYPTRRLYRNVHPSLTETLS